MMFYLNLYAVIFTTFMLLIFGEMFTALAFLAAYPSVFWDILWFSVLTAIGQNFILLTVFRFNSLVLTILTTTRKFFTVFASVLWFGHSLTAGQWLGVVFVFLGLGLNIEFKYREKQAKREKEKREKERDRENGTKGGKVIVKTY